MALLSHILMPHNNCFANQAVCLINSLCARYSIQMPTNTAEVNDYRILLEACIRALLREAKSKATLDDIRDYIFNQDHLTRPRVWIDGVIDLIGAAPGTVDIDVMLPVIQDAWNYLPHRSLNGRSPIERLLEFS
jgi:hypothetical protein